MSSLFRRYCWPVFQWAISLLALAYALWGMDITTLWESLQSYPLWSVALLLFPLCLDYAFMGLRLQALLPNTPPFLVSMKAVILCLGYNNMLPAKAGDVLKLTYLNRNLELPITTVVPCVLWERSMDVLMLTGLGFLAMLLAEVPASAAIGGMFLIVMAVFFVLARRFSAVLHALYNRLRYPRIVDALHNLHHHTVDAVTFFWVARGLIFSVAIWLFHCITFMLAFILVGQFDLTFTQMLTVFVVTALGSALPSSPASLGLFEGAMVLSLSWYGVGHSQALGFAILVHMLYILPISLGAICLGGGISGHSIEGSPSDIPTDTHKH